jgi:hypothetical protein
MVESSSMGSTRGEVRSDCFDVGRLEEKVGRTAWQAKSGRDMAEMTRQRAGNNRH